MKTKLRDGAHGVPLQRRSLVLAMMGAAAGVSACGGGGVADLIAGVSTGGTGSFASGAIRGFGSIIVNQVRYDDSKATVLNDDGVAIGSAGLKLGMTVDVDASDITTDAAGVRRSTASAVRVKPEIIGAVQTVSLATGTVTVLGQTVQVLSTTTLDDRIVTGLAGLRAGQAVAVHGLRDGSGQVVATRVELVTAPATYRLRGTVTKVDISNQRIEVGAAQIDYRQAARTGLTRTPQAGDWVKVDVATTTSNGVYSGLRMELQGTSVATDTLSSKARVEIEGLVSSITSATRFRVSGLEVDASKATVLPANLQLNQRLEVKGTLVGGILVAQEVERDGSNSGGSGEFEVEGPITRLDTVARTIDVRGLTIRYANAQFKDGTAASLKLNLVVEVKGELASDGYTLVATEVKIKS